MTGYSFRNSSVSSSFYVFAGFPLITLSLALITWGKDAGFWFTSKPYAKANPAKLANKSLFYLFAILYFIIINWIKYNK